MWAISRTSYQVMAGAIALGLLWPQGTWGQDSTCYLDLGGNQAIDLSTLCLGENSVNSVYVNSPFSVGPASPTTRVEQAFLAEYTVQFYSQDPELAQYAPTEADLAGAFGDRRGFEEILDNAYRVCLGQAPRWQFPEFTEVIFPGDSWTTFVTELATFDPLCAATQ
ncbi:MAG: hypothetical protein O3C67_04755 [Cyanobacteria bacterium]|nr:hypothetical protein [Cyanobacteriota bacterium]